MGTANDKQVGGAHYKAQKAGQVEHWDIVAQHDLDYFQGQITKYVMRWKNKNGVQDLQKAQHFLEKYIELNTTPVLGAVPGLAQPYRHLSDEERQRVFDINRANQE